MIYITSDNLKSANINKINFQKYKIKFNKFSKSNEKL